jgi:anaerobic magnesium-protoporphyrin IX monomethyl ester cyclase
VKVMMVVPRYGGKAISYYQFPLGLGYIAASIKLAGHSVTCVNLNIVEETCFESSLVEMLTSERPDLLATGGLSGWTNQVSQIFKIAKRQIPGLWTLVGGGMLSGEPEPVMRSTFADFGVIGEGEATVVALLNALESGSDLSDIDGLIYRCPDSEHLIRNKPRAALTDLNDLPWPDYELLGYPSTLNLQTPTDHYAFFNHSKPRSIDMITSRSCPFSCTFCFHPAGKVYRERDLDSFMTELAEYKAQYDINTVIVVDELFSLRRERLVEFCEKIRPLDLSWVVQLHVHSVDEDTLEQMRTAGCVAISYGIESMDQKVLTSMKKKSKVERVHSALELTAKAGIAIQGNLIFGDPAETVETANNSLLWWQSNRKWTGVHINMLEVWPGSPIYINAVRDEIITDRDAFANSLPVVTNISSMATANHNFLWSLLGIYTITGFSLALEQSVMPSEEILPGRSPAWDIQYRCPHCQASHNVRSSVIEETHWPLIRHHCRTCSLRSDFDNPNIPSAGQVDIQAAEKIINSFEKNLIPHERLTNLSSENQKRLHCRHKQVAKAKMLMAQHLYSAGDIVGAFYTYKHALRTNHNDTDLMLAIADTLADLNIGGGSRVVCERVLELDPQNIEANNLVKKIEGLSLEHRATMVISISDEPPPKRKGSKEAIIVRHKDKLKLAEGKFDIEPEFTHLEPA